MDNPSSQPQYANPEPVGFPSSPTPNHKKRPAALKWIIIAIVGLLIIGGAAFFVLSGGESETSDPTPTSSVDFIQTPQPTTAASPTAGPINRDDISVQILNGTGIAGEAGALQQILSSAGYKDIKTGNAPNTVTVTTMTYNSSTSAAVVTELTGLLEKTYQQVETKQSSTTGSADVTIVVGLRKGATPKPSAAATPAATTKASGTPAATTKPSTSPSATPQ